MRRSDGAEFFISKEIPTEQIKRLNDLTQICYAQYWPCVDGGYKPAAATDQVLIEYKAYIIQEKAKIITGEKPVSHWDEVLQGYYDAGYSKYVEQMLQYINR